MIDFTLDAYGIERLFYVILYRSYVVTKKCIELTHQVSFCRSQV
jgi:hypothetical protein